MSCHALLQQGGETPPKGPPPNRQVGHHCQNPDGKCCGGKRHRPGQTGCACARGRCHDIGYGQRLPDAIPLTDNPGSGWVSIAQPKQVDPGPDLDKALKNFDW